MPKPSDMKKRVLILCTGNSCRSQMAEGLWRKLDADSWEVFSAGSQPTGNVHALAIEVMREGGIDISRQSSKHVEQFIEQPFDLVVTVCDGARETCPTFPGAKQTEHWPFDDPAGTDAAGNDQLGVFRRVRDEIEETIRNYLTG